MSRVVAGPCPYVKTMTRRLSVVEAVLVEKRLMLREEIPIHTPCIETHQPQRITLRSEEVQVERVPPADEHT
jgi:stress response protein YsnF